MATPIIMPRQGQSVESCIISNWAKKVGDKVSAGSPISLVGNTGTLSTASHLHFELWHKGVPVNPSDYIKF